MLDIRHVQFGDHESSCSAISEIFSASVWTSTKVSSAFQSQWKSWSFSRVWIAPIKEEHEWARREQDHEDRKKMADTNILKDKWKARSWPTKATLRVFTREQSAQFEWSFELRIIRITVFWPKCTQISITKHNFNLNSAIQMMVWSCFPVTLLSNHAAKSHWPLNCDIGGAELHDLLTTSAYMYIPRTHCTCTWNASSVHVWLGGYPDTNYASSPRSGMLNRKSSFASSLVCTLSNSNTAITILHCNFKSALVWKQSYLLTLDLEDQDYSQYM